VNDAALVGRILREYHHRGSDPAAVHRVSGSVHGDSVTYLVDQGGGDRLVVRASRADAPVQVQFRVPGSLTMLDWLVTRAATLTCLERGDYPAPRLIRTRAGDPVGVDGVWLTLASTYIPGKVLRPTLDQLRMLGGALGRLHSMDPVSLAGGASLGAAGAGGQPEVFGAFGAVAEAAEGAGPGRAAWYPEAAIPATQARLDAVAELVPDDWLPMFEQFRQTVLAVQARLDTLPRGLVHGDAWPANAVQTDPDAVMLIDWETGGLGLPVLDLGQCLLECLLDAVPSGGGTPSGAGGASGVLVAAAAEVWEPEAWDPAVWLVEPDEDRIAAVAAGYSAWRVLTAAERAILRPAIRFGAAYVGAIHFEQALVEGVRGASMDARLDRLRNRLAVSETVARLAERHLPTNAEDAETVR
jgi:Ser/Thr protein kinase RdoA (MazF antagonist)